MDRAALISQFSLCDRVGNKIVDGMTHEDSMKQPAVSGSCTNWVLGHIILSRVHAMSLCQMDPLYPAERFERYKQGTPVLTKSSEAVPFEELTEVYGKLQEAFITELGRMTADSLEKPAPPSPVNSPDETVGSLLAKFAFHEAYHIGQAGMLRRVAGKPGAVG